jgi:ornithine decarboxylase
MNRAKFVLSRKKVLEQFKIVESVGDIISYSSKTNPLVSEILEEETDCFFSIHLKNELKNIKDMKRVVFLAQAWSEKDIKFLIEKKINFFIVDNEKDLDVLIDFLRNNDVKIRLFLRMKLKENSIRTERYFVFGMDSEIVCRRINEIREDNGLKNKIFLLGVHFHRKTQNMSEWNLKYDLLDSLGENILEKIDVLNIGGGLPSEYANTNLKVIENILDKIKEFRLFLNKKNIKLMLEPGRFIAAPSVKLVSEIIRIYDNNIIVNVSVYNSDIDALIVPVKLKVEGELDKFSGNPYVIKGLTPCSMDLFRYKVYLNDPKEGDKIVFLNAGAYNFRTDFCDLEEIETEIVD